MIRKKRVLTIVLTTFIFLVISFVPIEYVANHTFFQAYAQYEQEPKKVDEKFEEKEPEITYKPGEKLTNPELKEKLKELGKKLGADKIQVTDGDRTPEQNKKTYDAAKNSQHMKNKAADVKFYKDGKQIPPEEVAKAAKEAGSGFGGIGNYKTYTHVDTRDLKPDGSPAKW